MNGSRLRVLITALAMTMAMAIAAPARAQELSVGYQFQRVSIAGSDGAVNLPFGIDLDVAAPISGPFEVVGEFDWSRRTDSVGHGSDVDFTVNYYSFGGGVRVTAATEAGIRPFAHVLAGATRISGSNRANGQDLGGDSTTRGMFDVGGGIAAPLRGGLSAFGKVDYRRIFIAGGRLNAARVIVGIQLPLAVR